MKTTCGNDLRCSKWPMRLLLHRFSCWHIWPRWLCGYDPISKVSKNQTDKRDCIKAESKLGNGQQSGETAQGMRENTCKPHKQLTCKMHTELTHNQASQKEELREEVPGPWAATPTVRTLLSALLISTLQENFAPVSICQIADTLALPECESFLFSYFDAGKFQLEKWLCSPVSLSAGQSENNIWPLLWLAGQWTPTIPT